MDIDDFMAHMQIRTKSKETLRAYRSDLEKYEDFLRSKGLRVSQATRKTVEDFIRHLSSKPTRKAGAELSAASVNRRLSVVSAFYEFLRARSDGKMNNPVVRISRPKVDNVQFRAIDETTIDQLLSGITSTRDRAILALFIASGLRLSELHQLNKDTIARRQRKMPDGSIRTVGVGEVVGKGNKRRQFLVDEATLSMLVSHLRERGPDSYPALFLSSRRKRLSRRSIEDILHRWCRVLSLDRLHVHQLRHSFATRMANNGMASVVLKEIMGHSSFTATQRYFRIRPERLAREYFAAMESMRVE
jgi:site-specific recombinase XerD